MSTELLQEAGRLRRAGKLAEAAETYGRILSLDPHHFEALHALGILRYQQGQIADAERLIGQAAAANPKAADASYNHACLLQRMNRFDEALGAFDRALNVKPDYIEALVNRGSVLSALKRHQEALDNSERVIALKPELAEAWHNRGATMQALERFEDALQCFDRAVSLKPNYAEAWKNRAFNLVFLGRLDEALQSIDKAIELAPGNTELVCRRADQLALLNRTEEAAAEYEKYLTLSPDAADTWHARGFALKMLNRRMESLSCFEKAVNVEPGRQQFRESRGSMLFELERFDEAAGDFEFLLTLENPPAWAQGYRAISRLHCCDWGTLDSDREKISASIRAGQLVLDPTGIAVLSHSLDEQLQSGRIWAAEKYPASLTPLWAGEKYHHDKIRIAYLSADFRTHATAFLMAGIFEHHDRSRFQTVAMSYSADDHSPMRARLEAAFDSFIDVRNISDADVALKLREMEIDIAIDLKAYTAEGRPGILAQRAAPVQAHYLGFPGSMGVNYVDYLIADPITVPVGHRSFYSEKIAYLPDTYQCNDRARRIADFVPARADVGLPGGFVFCCFNNNHKIMPEIFDIWMRLLGAVEGSVLWLLQDNASVARNLRREAEARGIKSERLIFAPRTDPAAHLARHHCADLFLDTLPYNAHTTASDALWAGVPVLTALGSTFAGRVAASLLYAAQLPEMVTSSLADYETLALRLARAPAELAAIKAKLRANRDSCPLFDTARMTRSLEAAYETMWSRSQNGLPPETFMPGGAQPQ